MLTTAGMTLRSIGASVGSPRAAIDPAGAIAVVGLDRGGPGSGAGGRVHHQAAAARIRAPTTIALFRMPRFTAGKQKADRDAKQASRSAVQVPAKPASASRDNRAPCRAGVKIAPATRTATRLNSLFSMTIPAQ